MHKKDGISPHFVCGNAILEMLVLFEGCKNSTVPFGFEGGKFHLDRPIGRRTSLSPEISPNPSA